MRKCIVFIDLWPWPMPLINIMSAQVESSGSKHHPKTETVKNSQNRKKQQQHNYLNFLICLVWKTQSTAKLIKII